METLLLVPVDDVRVDVVRLASLTSRLRTRVVDVLVSHGQQRTP